MKKALCILIVAVLQVAVSRPLFAHGVIETFSLNFSKIEPDYPINYHAVNEQVAIFIGKSLPQNTDPELSTVTQIEFLAADGSNLPCSDSPVACSGPLELDVSGSRIAQLNLSALPLPVSSTDPEKFLVIAEVRGSDNPQAVGILQANGIGRINLSFRPVIKLEIASTVDDSPPVARLRTMVQIVSAGDGTTRDSSSQSFEWPITPVSGF